MPRLALSLLCALAACGILPTAALAGPTSPTTAVVAMGDSYISGEAGRWEGNSVDPSPGNSGTDRACQPQGPLCQVDKSRVYVGGSDANGCHRSDAAEVLTAQIPVDERINIACSGGQTKNVFRASSGGVGQNGEQPQADQLLPIARAKNVKLIVVSIGGNDLGFASIVSACLQAYVAKQPPCEPSQQKVIDERLPKATAAVGKSIDEIRAVMAEAGYAPSDYRLVLQTYPSVIPRAAENRYAEMSPERAAFGCPFYDSDSDWARDQAAPQIGTMVKTAAASRGVEELELIDALQGHEICAKSDREATPTDKPDAASSEWGRFVTASTVQQGDLQEAFHPNAYAQRALGLCLTGVFAAATPGRFACAGRAGIAPDALAFSRTGDVVGAGGGAPAARPRLRLAAKRARGRCFAFTVTSGGKPVRAARVSFTGRTARTDRRGHATICTRASGRRRAVARRSGYRSASRVVRIARQASGPSFTG